MKFRYHYFLYQLFVMFALPVFGQNKYFDKQIKRLASSEFHGRGYTNNGMDKTSKYLAKELKRLGVKPLNDNYFQTFTFPINIIQNSKLEINGKLLTYGKDYILKPSSKSISYTPSVQNYILDTEAYIASFQSKQKTIEFIKSDFEQQRDKHVILPSLNTSVDSIRNYYKQWANTYEKADNTRRAVFRFVADSLTASLSQRQSGITEFIIKEKYFSDSLEITNYEVKAFHDSAFSFNNVIGIIEGQNKDSIIVISAHYDHLGKVGEMYFPGASDNASGTAMVLDLAKYYVKKKPKYSIAFMFFGAEEAGIVGALKYVENPLFPLKKIKFLVNLDIMGAGEEGIQIVNGTKYTHQFNQMVDINNKNKYLKEIKVRGESCNSDHCPFDRKGVPSFFIYTLGGKGNYHNIYDTYENLDLSYSPQVKSLLIDFIDQL